MSAWPEPGVPAAAPNLFIVVASVSGLSKIGDLVPGPAIVREDLDDQVVLSPPRVGLRQGEASSLRHLSEWRVGLDGQSIQGDVGGRELYDRCEIGL